MRRSIGKFVIFSLSIFLCSCYDNQIYYDVDNESIVTCNRKPIDRLLVEQEHNYRGFIIEKIENEKGTNSLKLDSLNLRYKIYEYNREISVDSFRLAPNESYSVENHTYGDAASGRLQLLTNEQGRIIKASATSCK